MYDTVFLSGVLKNEPGVEKRLKENRKNTEKFESKFQNYDNLSVDEKALYYDSFHLNFFGGELVPVMMASKHRRLRILPTGPWDQKNIFHLYEVVCQSVFGASAYRPIYGLKNVLRIYKDISADDIRLTSWPDSFRAILDNSANVFIQTADADKYFDSKKANFINFRVSKDAFVYIGVDARNSKAMPWMYMVGFRSTGEAIRSSDFDCSYQVYKKFYRAHTVVRLGGCKIGFGSPSRMYIVVVTEVPVGHIEPTVDRTSLFDCHYYSNFSSFMSPKSNSWGRQLPKFSIGDSVFTDIDIFLNDWHPIFKNLKVLLLQTRNSDKSQSHTANYISCRLLQPSRVMVCIDNELKTAEIPLWLIDKGFSKMSLNMEAGGKRFFVYQQLLGAEVLSLSGLGLSKYSMLYNYFVIIVDEFEFQAQLGRHFHVINSPNSLPALNKSRSKEEMGIIALGSSSAGGIANEELKSTIAHPSINAFWDNSSINAVHCSTQMIAFHQLDRSWSSSSIDLKRGNAGEIMAGNCCFAVSVTHLPGVFQRTSLVTLLPRFIVVNNTGVMLRIFPFQSVEPLPPSLLTGNFDFSLCSFDNTFLVNPNEATALFMFFDPNLSVSETNSADPSSKINNSKPEERRRKRWLRSYDATLINNRDKVTNGLPSPLDDEFSFQPVCVDDIGEQFFWLKKKSCVSCGNSDKTLRQLHFDDIDEENNMDCSVALISVSVVLVGQTVVCTYRDVSNDPPFRIENRLPNITLRFRQKGAKHWIDLQARSWRAYTWTEYNLSILLEVCVKGHESKVVEYSMDKIGKASILHWAIEKSSTSTPSKRNVLLSPFTSELKRGSLRGYVYADKITRVLSLCEILPVSKFPNNSYVASVMAGNMMLMATTPVTAQGDNFGRVKNRNSMSGTPFHTRNRLKLHDSKVTSSNFTDSVSYPYFFRKLNASITVSAIAIKLVELKFPSLKSGGRSRKPENCEEIMDMSLEKMVITFNGPKYELSLSIFHTQIDDMRSNAKFPVVASPVDSGFNSHLSSDHVKIELPQIRVLFEWRPNAEKLIHISTLDIAIQQLRFKLDMDLIMRLINFGGLLLESIQEPILITSRNQVSHNRGDILQLLTENSLTLTHKYLLFTLTDKVMKSAHIQNDRLVYVELFHLSALITELEVNCIFYFAHTDMSITYSILLFNLDIRWTPFIKYRCGII